MKSGWVFFVTCFIYLFPGWESDVYNSGQIVHKDSIALFLNKLKKTDEKFQQLISPLKIQAEGLRYPNLEEDSMIHL